MLVQKHCVPCEGGILPLSRTEAEQMLQALGHEWELADDALSINKMFRFLDDRKAVAFINLVADIAIAENHHPNLTWVYNRVTLKHSTHAINGLSENDFVLAAKIEEDFRKK